MKHTNTDMILSNLIHDPQFASIVLPKMEGKYLTVGPTHEISNPHKTIYDIISQQYDKNGHVPTIDALELLLTQNMKVLCDADTMTDIKEVFETVKNHICKDETIDFRVHQAQEHAQTVESQIALLECADLIDLIEQGNTDKSRSEIVGIMGRVFDIDFNPDYGVSLHEGLEDYYDRLHSKDNLIPFDIKPLDDALAGGLKRKGLTLLFGCTNVGKTAVSCDFASRFISQGYNVLYITKEIPEDDIKERIYANVMNVKTSVLKDANKMPKSKFVKRTSNVLAAMGKMYVKYDSSNNFNADDVRILTQGLEKKNNIKFDIVFIDNLSNMSPITMKRRGNIRGDEILVEIAKELSNLSDKIDAHIIAPEQTNLDCEYKLHPELSDIANARGIGRVVDNAIAIGVNEEYLEADMIVLTIRKTRSKKSRGRHFRLGFNYDKQKSHEIDGYTGTVESEDDITEPVKKLTTERRKNRFLKNTENNDLLSL